MISHPLRGAFGLLGVLLGIGILNAPAWSSEPARKGAPKSQRGEATSHEISITKRERQPLGDTPAGQVVSDNKHPEGITWSGSDGDDVEKSPAKGQVSRSPSGQTATGGTIPVYGPGASQKHLGNFEIQDITSPRDPASGQAAGQAASHSGTPKPILGDILQGTDIRQQPPGQSTGIVSPRDVASGQATGK